MSFVTFAATSLFALLCVATVLLLLPVGTALGRLVDRVRLAKH